jgi:hypothetical protein
MNAKMMLIYSQTNQIITESFDLNDVIDFLFVIDMCFPEWKMIDNLEHDIGWQIEVVECNANVE